MKQFFLMTEIHRVSLAKSKSQFMRKMLLTNPIFKLVKMSNHFRQQYYSQISIRLLSSSTNPNHYREILTYIKKFLNNKKIPFVAPLSIITKPISNLVDKAELFTNFFVKKCTLIDNAREIPAKINIKQPKHFHQYRL